MSAQQIEREKVKCTNCFHREFDPDFVDKSSYLKPDNRRESICEEQPGKKTKNNLPRYCDLFKPRYVSGPPTQLYPQGKYRDIKKDPIGTVEGDPGYTGPITTVELCKDRNHAGGAKTIHKDGKCLICSHEDAKKEKV